MVPLTQGFVDSAMLAGSEVYTGDLDFYNGAGRAAKHNVPDASSGYEDLKKRFPGPAGDAESPTPTPTP